MSEPALTDVVRPCPDVLVDARPWGGFEQFTHNEPTTVKVITVMPGCRLSLQRHESRDELWVVLDPGAVVSVDGRESRPSPGERVWIPRGSTHRLGCAGVRPTRVLEIAFGDFDEDDIEPLADDYAR